MRRRPLSIAAVAALALVASLVAVTPTPAVAATGSITGTVVDGEGHPLAGVTVAVKPDDGNGPYEPQLTTTRADGGYTLVGHPGTVRVEPIVQGRIQFANGALELGRGASEARYGMGFGGGVWLRILDGEHESGVDFVVASRGSAMIAGTVSCAVSPPTPEWPWPAIHTPHALIELIDDGGLVVATDTGSEFTLPGVAPGRYTMRATSTGTCPTQTTYWSPAGVSASPVPFDVVAGDNGPFAVELLGGPDMGAAEVSFTSPPRSAPASSGASGYVARLYHRVGQRWERVQPRLLPAAIREFVLEPGPQRPLHLGMLAPGRYALAVGERITSSSGSSPSGIASVCPWYSGGARSLAAATPFEVTAGETTVLPHVELAACPSMPAGTITMVETPMVGEAIEPTLQGWAPNAALATVDWLDARPGSVRWLDSASSLMLTDEHRGAYPLGEARVAAPGFASSTVEVRANHAVRPQPRRLAGGDRYDTAAGVSRLAHPGTASVVYVASGTSYPDGLAAGPAAAHEGGPVLLTRRDAVPASTVAEIERLQPERIVIVGGEPSISAAVEAQLEALAGSVERVGGADRYETSRMLAERVFHDASWGVVATGASFPDALAAGGAAGRLGAPLLLVPRTSAADAATRGVLERLGARDVLVAGDVPSVSRATSEGFENAGMRTHRAAGADRYQTASFLAQFAFRLGADEVLVASGASFADALAGSAAAASMGIPLVLTRPQCQTTATVHAFNALGSPRATFLGGEPTISTASERFESCPDVAPAGGWVAPGAPR